MFCYLVVSSCLQYVLSAARESVAIFLRILFNQIMMELIVLKKENGVKGSEED